MPGWDWTTPDGGCLTIATYLFKHPVVGQNSWNIAVVEHGGSPSTAAVAVEKTWDALAGEISRKTVRILVGLKKGSVHTDPLFKALRNYVDAHAIFTQEGDPAAICVLGGVKRQNRGHWSVFQPAVAGARSNASFPHIPCLSIKPPREQVDKTWKIMVWINGTSKTETRKRAREMEQNEDNPKRRCVG